MGSFRQALMNMKTALIEDAQRRKLEQEQLRQRMAPYCRGYDVYADEINAQYTSLVRSNLIKSVLIKGTIFAAAVTLMVLMITNKSFDVFPIAIFGGFICLVLMMLFLSDISHLSHFISGKYDCYGAMVTNTRVESHTSTDSDGNTTTSYDYFVSLNGVECEVTSKEYRKAPVGQYMHFVRLKAKYRKSDVFYFFPCPQTEEQFIIGHHSPAAELRLYRPEKGSGILTALSVLCILGAFASMIWVFASSENGKELSVYIPAGLTAASILFAIINKCVGLSKGRKKLEEKRRMQQGE